MVQILRLTRRKQMADISCCKPKVLGIKSVPINGQCGTQAKEYRKGDFPLLTVIGTIFQ